MNDLRQQTAGNNKYKTALCKHFSQTGNCPKKTECAFAHGEHELQAALAGMGGSNPSSNGGNAANGGYQKKPFIKNNLNQMNPMMQHPMQNNYKSQLCRYFDAETGQCHCKYESKCNFAHSKEELRERVEMPNKGMQMGQMLNTMPPLELQLFHIQQQQVAVQLTFLQTLLMHKLSVGLYQLMPQIEQVIDKSKHLDFFKSAETMNRSGNPLGSIDILYQILREGESEKDQELMADIDEIQKETMNMDGAQLQALLSQFGMTPLEINQLSMLHQQNLQMQMMTYQQQQQIIPQYQEELQ